MLSYCMRCFKCFVCLYKVLLLLIFLLELSQWFSSVLGLLICLSKRKINLELYQEGHIYKNKSALSNMKKACIELG